MQCSKECKIARTIPQGLGFVREPLEHRVTDGKSRYRQMTSDRRGNGDVGLEETRPVQGSCPGLGGPDSLDCIVREHPKDREGDKT